MEVKYFKNCKNPAEIAGRYQTISQVFDFHGSPEVTPLKKEVEAEYRQVLSAHQAIQQSSSEPQEESLEGIIGKIESIGLSGEVCGKWLWVNDQNAFKHKDYLRSLGFRYARGKKSWYWRPDEFKCDNQDPMPMDYIREKYGSETITVKS